MAAVRLRRLLLLLVLIVPLAGCGAEPSDGTEHQGGGSFPPPPTEPRPSAPPPPPPPPPSYQVLDSACPDGWTGLRVTTDDEAEVEYLDDIPACTNDLGDTTYLENDSDAVWILRSTSYRGGSTKSWNLTLEEQSFLQAVQGQRAGRAIFVPGADLTVDLPPEEVEWVIDLPLSVGWEAHDLVLDKIEGAGQEAAVAALRRQSRAGAALATCALAATTYAETVEDLEDADAVEVVLGGLGVGAASSACHTASASVSRVDDAGRNVALADDLEHLRRQTAVLQNVDTRLGYAQRASKVFQLGLKFLR